MRISAVVSLVVDRTSNYDWISNRLQGREKHQSDIRVESRLKNMSGRLLLAISGTRMRVIAMALSVPLYVRSA